MYLSLWIIHENLSSTYTTKAHIIEGAMCIRNASLLFVTGKVSAHTVYVCASESFIPTLGGKVICVCRNDYLIIETGDFEAVFNEVVEIIDRYSEWDMAARDRIEQGCSLQELVEFDAGFFSRLVGVVDAGFIFQAVAGQQFAAFAEEDRAHLALGDGLPIEYAREFLKVHRQHPDATAVFQARYPFYPTVGLGKNVEYKGQVWGCCIIVTDRVEATKADRQVMEAFANQVEKWKDLNADEDDAPRYSQMLADIVSRRGFWDETETQEYFDRIGWKESDEKYYVVVRSMRPMGFHYMRLRSHVIKSYPGCLFVDTHDQVAMVINTAYLPIQELVNYLQSLFGDGVHAGISYAFGPLPLMDAARKQAETAAEMCSNSDTAVLFCKDCILDHIWGQLSLQIGPEQAHPAIKRLREEGSHGDTYLETLETYLMKERSLVRTSKALGIHVNTLKYRLAKIQELCPLELDDDDTRLYLLLSFRITGAHVS